jgi:predicted RNA-binding Zn-ribbon protein involved in translation (DUF1610 family)
MGLSMETQVEGAGMVESRSMYAECRNCGAKHRVVRKEGLRALPQQQVCYDCGAPLPAREGRFFLVYYPANWQPKSGR